MLHALRLILVLALIGLLTWPLVAGLRSGELRLRGGGTLTRRRQPVQFWTGIAAGIAFLLVAIGFFVRIAFFGG
jgi:hypothetical protein